MRLVACRILLVEDDRTVAEVVTRYLELDGFAVEWVADGRTAIDRATADPPDLMVLDLMLPKVDGLEVCRRVRALNPVPVIMLTARSDETDRIVGLDLGADDYVTKPFSPRELVSRVKAVLRRVGPNAATVGPNILTAGTLTVDVAARVVTRGDDKVALTAREFELLELFLRDPGRVLSKESILDRLWGYAFDDNLVEVYVGYLRRKLGEPQLIHTLRGAGYTLREPA